MALSTPYIPQFREDDHVTNMRNLCIICFQKSKSHVLNEHHKMLLSFIYEDFWIHEHYLPGGLCEGCRLKLESQANPDEKKQRKLGKTPKYAELVAYVRKVVDAPTLRSQQKNDYSIICDCELCDRSKLGGRHGKLPPCRFLEEEKPSRGRPRKPENPPDDPSPIKTCSKCGQKVGQGIRHPCSRRSRYQHLKDTLSPRTQAMLAKDVVKEKIDEAKKVGKDFISLTCHYGRPLIVSIKGKKRAVITKEMIAKYRYMHASLYFFRFC